MILCYDSVLCSFIIHSCTFFILLLCLVFPRGFCRISLNNIFFLFISSPFLFYVYLICIHSNLFWYLIFWFSRKYISITLFKSILTEKIYISFQFILSDDFEKSYSTLTNLLYTISYPLFISFHWLVCGVAPNFCK